MRKSNKDALGKACRPNAPGNTVDLKRGVAVINAPLILSGDGTRSNTFSGLEVDRAAATWALASWNLAALLMYDGVGTCFFLTCLVFTIERVGSLSKKPWSV